jgi:hypothetical protein
VAKDLPDCFFGTYSSGTVQDSHLIPFCIFARRTTGKEPKTAAKVQKKSIRANKNPFFN